MLKKLKRMKNSIKNVLRAIRYYVMYLSEYDSFMWFMYNHLNESVREELIARESESGYDTRYRRNRFAFALHNTKMWWKHRDMLSDICTGDCESCKALHC